MSWKKLFDDFKKDGMKLLNSLVLENLSSAYELGYSGGKILGAPFGNKNRDAEPCSITWKEVLSGELDIEEPWCTAQAVADAYKFLQIMQQTEKKEYEEQWEMIRRRYVSFAKLWQKERKTPKQHEIYKQFCDHGIIPDISQGGVRRKVVKPVWLNSSRRYSQSDHSTLTRPKISTTPYPFTPEKAVQFSGGVEDLDSGSSNDQLIQWIADAEQEATAFARAESRKRREIHEDEAGVRRDLADRVVQERTAAEEAFASGDEARAAAAEERNAEVVRLALEGVAGQVAEEDRLLAERAEKEAEAEEYATAVKRQNAAERLDIVTRVEQDAARAAEIGAQRQAEAARQSLIHQRDNAASFSEFYRALEESRYSRQCPHRRTWTGASGGGTRRARLGLAA
jgi:hypothetical protein